jgi:hypothetical protein
LLGLSCPPRRPSELIRVAGEQEAERAAALLESQGYSVVVSPALDE